MDQDLVYLKGDGGARMPPQWADLDWCETLWGHLSCPPSVSSPAPGTQGLEELLAGARRQQEQEQQQARALHRVRVRGREQSQGQGQALALARALQEELAPGT